MIRISTIGAMTMAIRIYHPSYLKVSGWEGYAGPSRYQKPSCKQAGYVDFCVSTALESTYPSFN